MNHSMVREFYIFRFSSIDEIAPRLKPALYYFLDLSRELPFLHISVIQVVLSGLLCYFWTFQRQMVPTGLLAAKRRYVNNPRRNRGSEIST